MEEGGIEGERLEDRKYIIITMLYIKSVYINNNYNKH